MFYILILIIINRLIMLTHLDKRGNAKIVDISSKKKTLRVAIAKGNIFFSNLTLEEIKKNSNKKGDILSVSKIAGIIAAKKTSELIPLCHQIFLDNISIEFQLNEKNLSLEVTTSVNCFEKTGAEMEALTATSITLLTIYDMCKANDKGMIISNIKLIKKTGGKSDFESNK